VPYSRKYLLSPQTVNPDWRIRDDDDTFQSWWRSQNLTTILFDGASKGNPGVAVAGGVIYSPDGSSKDCFCWGLGQKSNNQADILGLLKACLIAREKGVKDLQVFGDSEIIIKKLNMEAQFSNASLNKTLVRLKRVLLDNYEHPSIIVKCEHGVQMLPFHLNRDHTFYFGSLLSLC
jgi:hypothetical protein